MTQRPDTHGRVDIPLLAQIARLRFIRTHALLESLDIHPGQYHLLVLVAHAGGMSQRELASHLYIKPSTLAVMIGRLMRANLVQRKRDPKDRRILRIYITERGEMVMKQAMSRFARMEQETFVGFTEEEEGQFAAFAQRIINNLLEATEEERPPCPWF